MKKDIQELNSWYWQRRMKSCFDLNSNGKPVLSWRNVINGTKEQVWSYLTSPLHCHLYLSSFLPFFLSALLLLFFFFFCPTSFFINESVYSKLLIGFLYLGIKYNLSCLRETKWTHLGIKILISWLFSLTPKD